jgi:hypothetical protein
VRHQTTRGGCELKSISRARLAHLASDGIIEKCAARRRTSVKSPCQAHCPWRSYESNSFPVHQLRSWLDCRRHRGGGINFIWISSSPSLCLRGAARARDEISDFIIAGLAGLSGSAVDKAPLGSSLRDLSARFAYFGTSDSPETSNSARTRLSCRSEAESSDAE